MTRFLGALLALWAGWTSACDRGKQGPADVYGPAAKEPADTALAAGTAQPASEVPASPVSFETTDVRPTTASPTEPLQGRPPHPAIPAPIDEAQPAPNTVASTTYLWLPGHWVWTGNQYEWQPGVWVYELPEYVMLPPQWTWDGEYWTFRDAGWAIPGTSQAVYRPSALPDGSSTVAPTSDSNEAQLDLEVRASSYAVYVWTGTWVAPPIVYPSDAAAAPIASRYARRIKASDPGAPPEPSPHVAPPIQVEQPSADPGIVVQATPRDTTGAGEEQVEYEPGVLHGGKRGEEELRLMQEAQEREAAEQDEGVDAVYVPYYGTYPPYYPARPVRPRPPPRPTPLPARPPPPRSPGPRPQ